ncbi:LysR family transcriptional regulator [Hoyosella subflava]|uniref:LysR-family transcriptional regulator n=1 Tax=Hoyosella subflava (strain DSM 45089 / JCM 17490 / NBRC 109087 / DQS3-9A1) TaxID=443218 RepID=F6EEU9_HOYSD|nr:LysR family transcriptional regulator [Hoyosella subflava]AEF40899.1 LysR-family transcriptional regulator [Hoyosella subflava DQS3-9A1]
MAGAARDLNHLRTFLAVHRTGSFTAAARVLELSQPTVTAHIAALERELGRELFARRGSGVSAAPYADALAAQIAGPLDSLAIAALPSSADPRDEAQPVHLAGPAELLSARVLPALSQLVVQGVRVRIATGLTDPLLDELRVGRHDLVIATTRPRSRSVDSVPLMDEEFVLVASPAWAGRLRASGAPQRIAEEVPRQLHSVPLIAYAEDLPITRRYWRHVFGRKLAQSPSITVPDLRSVKAAVIADAGFAVLPRYLCVEALASGALTELYSPDDPPINTAYLAWRSGPSTNPHVALVREEIRRAARAW